MGFLDDLQSWLAARAAGRAPRGPDLAALRAVVWEALESIDDDDAQARAQSEWTKPGYLEAFVDFVHRGVVEGIGEQWPDDRIEAAVAYALHAQVRGSEIDPSKVGGRVVARELARSAMEAGYQAIRRSVTAPWDEAWLDAWARAVRLVADDGSVTVVGRAVLGLVGREAVQFLLELEVALSTGVKDEHRVSRRALGELAGGRLDFHEFQDPASWPNVSYKALTRLAWLGVAHHQIGHDGEDWFELAPDAADLAATTCDPAPNPYRALVSALLDAERGRVTTAVTGVAGRGDTDLAYVRLVVHELRNVSVPLKNALDRLWTELEREDGPAPAKVGELRQRVERSMTRIIDFARDSARLASAVTDETFPLRDVLDEAIRATEPDRNGRIKVDARVADDALLMGSRPRWVLLFVNLLRNAAQVRAGSGSVQVSSEWSVGGPLRIFVDDDGPGVPDELREQIFELGVSTHGGSGIGLHEARTTVLLSGGSMRCDASPLGGARFFIQVPARRRS